MVGYKQDLVPLKIIEDQELTLCTEEYSLLTDLYQLTMIACYVGEKIENCSASFEVFVRSLPDNFGYLIAMGLAQALDYLQKLHFTPKQIEALRATNIFADAPTQFWSILESGMFTGDVWAVPEGTAVFPYQPILRIEAPLWQAQLVETYLLNTINYQTLIATKAARLRDVAGDEAILLEFGTRRAFSPQGAIWAARAALAGGLNATSNVLAAMKLGCQPSGTMAHALVMAISALSGSEDEAFMAFHRYFPSSALLIDTFDTEAAVKRLAEKVKTKEMELTGVRLDSGDLVKLSQLVRSLLGDIKIFASGDLDEWEITRLKKEGATIDGYGLGTKLVTGNPVNGVYKLVEIDGIATMKKSSNKSSYPGRKQIFRTDKHCQIEKDRLGLANEFPQSGEKPLLQLVMKNGQPTQPPETIETIQKRTYANVASLPNTTRQITDPTMITVEISPALENLRHSLLKKKND